MEKKSVVAPIFLVVLADICGWSMILPLLPFYAERAGASPAKVGALFSIYALGQLIASPILSSAADRFGRKPVLVFSLAGSFLSLVWLGFASDFWSILASRALSGLTAGNLAIAHACVADGTGESERPHAFGALSIAYAVGFLAGPVVSSLLVRSSFCAPIAVAAALSALGIVSTVALLPSDLSVGPTFIRKHPRPGNWRFSAVLLALFFVSFNLFTSGLGLFAERLYRPGGMAFGAAQLGWLYTFVGGVGIVIQTVCFKPIVQRLGESWTIVVGFLSAALGFGSLTLVADWPGILGITALAVFGTALLRPTLSAVLARAAGSGHHREILGLSQSIHGAAQLVAPLATGALIGGGLLRGWSCAIAGLLASGLVLSIRWRNSYV